MGENGENEKRRLGRYGRLGILLAAVGIILGVDVVADLSFLYKLWPLLTALLGAGFIGIYIKRDRREAGYIGLGTWFVQFSAFALYCNFTSWGELARLWPLFIAFTGVSFLFSFFMSRTKPLLLLGGLLFISVSTIFLIVFQLSHRLWWTSFLFAGASFLVFDRVRAAHE